MILSVEQIDGIVKDMLAKKMEEGGVYYALVAEKDGRFMGKYDSKEDAIEDAESMSQAAPGTSYRICRCDKDGHFDYDDCVHTTFNEGKIWLSDYLRENISDLIKMVVTENARNNEDSNMVQD